MVLLMPPVARSRLLGRSAATHELAILAGLVKRLTRGGGLGGCDSSRASPGIANTTLLQAAVASRAALTSRCSGGR